MTVQLQEFSVLLRTTLKTKNLPLSCCFGLGTDGASVMRGEHAGVGALLREQNPFIRDFHCLAHKLALAASQAADEVTYMTKYSKCVSAIFSFSVGQPNELLTCVNPGRS